MSLPGLVAGELCRLEDRLERLLVAAEVRREAPLVADRGDQAPLLQQRLELVEGLGAHAQRLGEVRGAGRDDHELLDVEVVVGVPAAVDDVHHRHRQRARVDAAEVLVERQAGLFGRGPGDRDRDAEDRVGAELLLGLGAVGADQRAVDVGLVVRLQADDLGAEHAVDVVDRLEHALAAVALLVAVAQLEGLAAAGGRAGGHGEAAPGAALEGDLHLDGGVAAGIEDFTGQDVDDLGHGAHPPVWISDCR